MMPAGQIAAQISSLLHVCMSTSNYSINYLHTSTKIKQFFSRLEKGNQMVFGKIKFHIHFRVGGFPKERCIDAAGCPDADPALPADGEIIL